MDLNTIKEYNIKNFKLINNNIWLFLIYNIFNKNKNLFLNKLKIKKLFEFDFFMF